PPSVSSSFFSPRPKRTPFPPPASLTLAPAPIFTTDPNPEPQAPTDTDATRAFLPPPPSTPRKRMSGRATKKGKEHHPSTSPLTHAHVPLLVPNSTRGTAQGVVLGSFFSRPLNSASSPFLPPLRYENGPPRMAKAYSAVDVYRCSTQTQQQEEEGERDPTDLRDPFSSSHNTRAPVPSSFRFPADSLASSTYSSSNTYTYFVRRSSYDSGEGQQMRMSQWGRLPLAQAQAIQREREREKKGRGLPIDTTCTSYDAQTQLPTRNPTVAPFNTFPSGHLRSTLRNGRRPQTPTPSSPTPGSKSELKTRNNGLRKSSQGTMGSGNGSGNGREGALLAQRLLVELGAGLSPSSFLSLDVM
ncbi:hypothetical protein DXG01_016701, partial [Tephrocybe rancida]